MLHVSVSAYKQAEAERKSDLICQKVGGGGTCMHPGRGSNNGPVYTISTRVDGDVLKVFWSYCSEVGFIKVPHNNEHCIWVQQLQETLQWQPVKLWCAPCPRGLRQCWKIIVATLTLWAHFVHFYLGVYSLLWPAVYTLMDVC